MEEFDELFEIRDEVQIVRKRYIRDMSNPLEFYSGKEFQRRYRFTKDCVTDILFPLVRDRLLQPRNRGLPIPPMIQLLTALRFYGCNSFQLVNGDLRGLSQSTISRIVRNMSIYFAELLDHHISFPRNANQFRLNTASFYEIAGFPNVSGCIDCTHIAIKNPGGENAEVFRNRKGWFSLNVQVVAGPKLEILDIVVRHPGSTHDSVIFNRSALRARLELGQIPGLLLGDNGYACKHYLLTTFIDPNTTAERRYNNAHKTTRNIVERLFGIWKRRFACVHSKLRTKLTTSIPLICAVAVLYNIGLRYNQNNILENYIEDEPIDEGFLPDNEGLVGLAFRRAFAEAHF